MDDSKIKGDIAGVDTGGSTMVDERSPVDTGGVGSANGRPGLAARS